MSSVSDPTAPDILELEDERPSTFVFDWLVELAIPVAVFGLLGCFFYYLIDLRSAFGGESGSFLRWLCFWFLLGSIGISRIRTRYGDDVVALPYIVALFGAAFFACYAFTSVAGALVSEVSRAGAALSFIFNCGLVVLVAWVSSLVTRECTGEDAFGQEERPSLWATLFGRDSRTAAAAGAQKRHNPQRTLLYLSGAVLAIFALGQRIIGDKGTFSGHAFWCMIGYLFFAFVLLALTNLSTLRIEARRRKLHIAKSLTPSWITAATVLVVGILLISALIPRMRGNERIGRAPEKPSWTQPAPKTTLSQGPAAGIAEPPQGESRDPSNTQGGPTDQSRRSSETTKSTAGQGGERQVATQGTGGTEPGAEQTEGTPRPAGAAQTSGKGNQGQGKGQTSGGGGGGGGSSSSATASSQAQSGTSGAGAGGQTRSTDTKGKPEGHPNEKSDQEAGGTKGKRETPAAPKFNWLLWLLLLLLLALIIYLLIRYRDAVKLFLARAWQALCAPFVAMWAALQRLWARLMAYFGRRARAGDDSGEVSLPVNPFEDIFSNRYLFENLTPSQMATHVYRAFMALCDLRGHGRLAEQTEREFLRVVPDGVGIARPDREGITGVYIQARYSPSSVGPDAVPTLQDYWSRLKPQIDATLAAMGRSAVRQAA